MENVHNFLSLNHPSFFPTDLLPTLYLGGRLHRLGQSKPGRHSPRSFLLLSRPNPLHIISSLPAQVIVENLGELFSIHPAVPPQG